MLSEVGIAKGTSGPGEKETIQIIEEAGASDDNPIDVHIGRRIFRGVTGAVKPPRTTHGEAKIDVLLLSGPNTGHPNGAFSFKDVTFPTYGGYSSIVSVVKGGRRDVQELLQSYIEMLNPPEVKIGRRGEDAYEFAGDFAMRASDSVAHFAIYGGPQNSGGTDYGKNRVDHVVEVTGPLTWSWLDDEQAAIQIEGLKIYPRDHLFRGDASMEPYWLVRKESGSSSGLPGLRIANARIAVAPALRACGSERCVVKETARSQHTYMEHSSHRSTAMRDRALRILLEELTAADKREIEKIARKQSERTLSQALGPDIMKTIRDEVEKVTGKTLASKDSKAQIEELVIAVVKRLYKDITVGR